jgi:60 kDa SS-A/Ro ribonucleoprotein
VFTGVPFVHHLGDNDMPTTDPLAGISTRRTDQRDQADPAQTPNDAGGWVFSSDADHQLHRFLTLGTTGGTYYAGEAELTRRNVDVVLAAARDSARARQLVADAVTVSQLGRAPSNNPALFALAVVAGLGDRGAREFALRSLPQVARTGTHLFTFLGYLENFRGHGRMANAALRAWYTDRDPDQLAYQLAKYRQRGGWSHRDVLRLCKPRPERGSATDAALRWAVGKAGVVDLGDGLSAQDYHLPELLGQFERAQRATTVDEWVGIIAGGARLSWEMFPDAALTEPAVWRALVEAGRVPPGALLRQLPRLTRLGVLDGSTLAIVRGTLTNPAVLARARVHPVSALVAARTYASGRGRGSSWTPERRVSDVLDGAFYAAYGSVEPTGKRTLVALDVSGSMGREIGGGPLIAREFAAAQALVLMSADPDLTDVVGFTSGTRSTGGWGWGGQRSTSREPISPLDITPRRRLDDVLRYTAGLDFGGTDCALPLTWALDGGGSFGGAYDSFVIITDNETWAGPVHVHQALRTYRDTVNPSAKLITVATTATNWEINDPADPLGLDLAGFDSAVPQLVSDFSAGRL